MSLVVPVVSALLELADGMEAQPARVDAALINNIAPRIRAAFAFSAIGFPNSRIRIHLAPLYAIEPREVKSIHGRWEPDLAQRIPRTSASRLPVRNTIGRQEPDCLLGTGRSASKGEI
jgi:hypothetical protein